MGDLYHRAVVAGGFVFVVMVIVILAALNGALA